MTTSPGGPCPFSLRRNAVKVVAVGSCVTALLTACTDEGDRGGRGLSQEARLEEELVLGSESEPRYEYQFFQIHDLVVARDGTLWILDGAGERFLLRQYDSAGTFLRTVGGVGSGPGEFRDPFALGLMPDGRVVLRDRLAPARITVYTPDGLLDTTWNLDGWEARGAASTHVDTAGVVWAGFARWRRPAADPPPLVYVRVLPDGTVLDTVPPPPTPEVERDTLRLVRRLSGGAVSTRGFDLPFQPRGSWAWSPSGAFATLSTNEYRISVLSPVISQDSGGPSDSPRPVSVIGRDVPLVPVSEAERRDRRQKLLEQVSRVEGAGSLRVPEIPAFKPPITRVDFSEDNRLWVSVSMPSLLKDGVWEEPLAYDVFEADGRYRGRVVPPPVFSLRRMRGDLMWGVAYGEYEVESVRRYRIRWPGNSH